MPRSTVDADVFADTGGLFALLVRNDEWHGRAVRFVHNLRKSPVRLVTTD